MRWFFSQGLFFIISKRIQLTIFINNLNFITMSAKEFALNAAVVAVGIVVGMAIYSYVAPKLMPKAAPVTE